MCMNQSTGNNGVLPVAYSNLEPTFCLQDCHSPIAPVGCQGQTTYTRIIDPKNSCYRIGHRLELKYFHFAQFLLSIFSDIWFFSTSAEVTDILAAFVSTGHFAATAFFIAALHTPHPHWLLRRHSSSLRRPRSHISAYFCLPQASPSYTWHPSAGATRPLLRREQARVHPWQVVNALHECPGRWMFWCRRFTYWSALLHLMTFKSADKLALMKQKFTAKFHVLCIPDSRNSKTLANQQIHTPSEFLFHWLRNSAGTFSIMISWGPKERAAGGSYTQALGSSTVAEDEK